MLKEFFTSNLVVVYLVYGLSFVTMAIAILIQPRRESIFKLSGVLWLLAVFGVSHGISEWLDMLSVITVIGHRYTSSFFSLIRVSVLVVSFVFLLEFGRRMVCLRFPEIFNKRLTVYLAAITFLLMAVFTREPSIWARYILGFPGALLSAFGFIWYYYDNKKILKPIKVGNYFMTAAFSIGIYSIMGGLIVPKSDFFLASAINSEYFLNLIGIPVQVFRSLCAVILSWAVWKILGIFNWEMRQRLEGSLRETTMAKNGLDNIITSMVDSLIILGPDARIKAVNQATQELLGYKKEECIGMLVNDICVEKEPLFLGNKFQKLLRDGSVKNYELTYKTKNGSLVPVLLSASVIRDKHGDLEGIVGIAKDITERKHAEEIIRESEEKYRLIFETAASLIMSVNSEGIVVDCNSKIKDVLGYEKDEIIGCAIETIICPHYVQKAKSMFAEIVTKGFVYNIECKMIRKDTSRAYVKINSSAIRNEEGIYYRIIYIIEDITERKFAEEELIHAYNQLKLTQYQLIQAEKMDTVGRLASGVAHEVKNPLAIILQGMDYLSKKIPDNSEDVALTLKYVNDAVERANIIVKGLLEFSRITEMNEQPENLNAIMENSLFLIKNSIEQNHIEVFRDFGKEIPLVNLDKTKIEQVFVNIILNAVQAMPEGGQIKIKTYTQEKPGAGKWVIAQIEDSGSGIPEDMLEKIFEPFFTTKRDKGGTGLGLSVVNNIIDMHDGKISIGNKKDGQGAVVTVMLRA